MSDVIEKAREKLINIFKPEYTSYIENHLAGDFAVELIKELEQCHKVVSEAEFIIKSLETDGISNIYFGDLIKALSQLKSNEDKVK